MKHIGVEGGRRRMLWQKCISEWGRPNEKKARSVSNSEKKQPKEEGGSI